MQFCKYPFHLLFASVTFYNPLTPHPLQKMSKKWVKANNEDTDIVLLSIVDLGKTSRLEVFYKKMFRNISIKFKAKKSAIVALLVKLQVKPSITSVFQRILWIFSKYLFYHCSKDSLLRIFSLTEETSRMHWRLSAKLTTSKKAYEVMFIDMLNYIYSESLFNMLYIEIKKQMLKKFPSG